MGIENGKPSLEQDAVENMKSTEDKKRQSVNCTEWGNIDAGTRVQFLKCLETVGFYIFFISCVLFVSTLFALVLYLPASHLFPKLHFITFMCWASTIIFLLVVARLLMIEREESSDIKDLVAESSNTFHRFPQKRKAFRWTTKKSPEEIGRMYEKYIGSLYESEGFEVDYVGISEGFHDKGIDLIATKDNTVVVIQCKYWAKRKTIHENLIHQFNGSAFSYRQKNPDKTVLAFFITSAKLSNTAKDEARIANINVRERISLGTKIDFFV